MKLKANESLFYREPKDLGHTLEKLWDNQEARHVYVLYHHLEISGNAISDRPTGFLGLGKPVRVYSHGKPKTIKNEVGRGDAAWANRIAGYYKLPMPGRDE